LKSQTLKLIFALFLFLLFFSLAREKIDRSSSSDTQSQELSVEKDAGPTAESLATQQFLWAQAAEDSPSNRLDSIEARLSAGRRTAIVRAASRVAQAVVSVNVIQTEVVATAYRDFFGYFYVPRRREVQNLGSGFIINSRGYILTNEHVVHQASKVTITTSDGAEYDAEIVGLDANSDLALLKIDPGNTTLPVAQLGDSDELYLGEWVIAIGSPFGLLLEDPQPTVTVGVISAIGRDILPDDKNPDKVYANMIQTDAAINPGNSGGPLANSLGEVIGINTFIFTPSGGSVGMGFAIPINRAKRIAEELIRGGKVRHPWLGIKVQDLTPEILVGLGYPEGKRIQGVVIANILPYSPAAAGNALQPGDIITHLDGKPVRSSADWAGEMFDLAVNTPVRLTVLRGGRSFNVTLVAEEKPTETLKRYPTGYGFELIDLTPEVRSQLGVKVQSGAVVAGISDPDLEREGSILLYDVLYRINNIRITGAEHAVRLLNSIPRGRVVVLFLERDGRRIRRYLSG